MEGCGASMQKHLKLLGVLLAIAVLFGFTAGDVRLAGLLDKSMFKPDAGSVFSWDKGLDAVAATNRKDLADGPGTGRDDTESIQAMINSMPAAGGDVIIPAGTYLIDAVKSIWLRSNINLILAPDAILKVIPNHSGTYAVLQIADIQNVSISGGIILGDRKEHLGREGEWGMGIRITGSQNIIVEKTAVNDCWGDGFYLGAGAKGNPVENIRLVDVQADNNRRQGISLISGRNVKIVRPRLTNTKGTPPAAGLDIEPNRASDVVENIEILDAVTAGNAEGIVVSLQKLNENSGPISIHIQNHRDDGSGRGMLISSNGAIVGGKLTIEDAAWLNAKKNGLSIQNHSHRSFAIEIVRPRIVDANRSGSFSAATGSAVAIYQFRGRSGGIGNVSIINPSITDTGATPKTLRAFYISNNQDEAIAQLFITNPMIGENLSNSNISKELSQYIR